MLDFFFLPFCLVWNLVVRGCSLPPSLPQPSAQSEHGVYDSVTQSGSPGVRVSVAHCVSCCQEDTLRTQPKIKEIITDFGITNSTTARVRYRTTILFAGVLPRK